ncbi:DeoR/GlpR family DNA-binding transcription regulator [Parafilimonas terrae]|jgi:DeoR family transcriptional regulator of aga operon|uniref:Transcriptional regulator, DeoR family n=1 Tax=Parafilimonas terrae TaxID=1465490 RepID=A0A1I5RMY9_9BACT|nr:DeoR/GlpR family DNA-binding transcription regulator [Parafilimonas terrae]SFP59918.1 transcriptional regulator, DeoR family [Parafilimonas terrae]
MTSTERHQLILEKLHQEGDLNVISLYKELRVSRVTIRKDLKLLEEKGLLFRTHGGATLKNPYTIDRPVNEKEKLQSGEKSKIGAAAARLIDDNDSIIIASGTTVLALAKKIQNKKNLTVITASLNVALELLQQPDIEVLQLGGILRKTSSSVTGPYAQSILADFSCTKLFLGVDGIDLEFGLSTTSAMEAHLNRQMIEASQKVIVLSDSTKFGKRGFGKICGLDKVDRIITDAGISEHFVKQLENLGIEVTVV